MSAAAHGGTSRKAAIFRVLAEMAKAHPYVSFERIKDRVIGPDLTESIQTLKAYLSEAVDRGGLYKAGRGWYTRNQNAAQLDVATVSELKGALSERFPFLPHYLWSPLQFNPWLHHQLGRVPIFGYVDADGAEDMAEFLREEGWEVALNPGKHDPAPARRERSVVLRGVRREIAEDEPPLETALVDLLLENERLHLMDAAEYRELVRKILAEHRVDVAWMLRRLGDRKRTLAEIIGEESTRYLGIF